MTWTCGSCGATNGADAGTCGRCGAERDALWRGPGVATAVAAAPGATTNGRTPYAEASARVSAAPAPTPLAVLEPWATGADAESAPAPATDLVDPAEAEAEILPLTRPHTTPVGSDEADLGTAPLARRPDPVPAGHTFSSVPTQVMPFDLEHLHALPVGTLLAGRYVIKGQVETRAGRNLYRAEAWDLQRCPTCGNLAMRDATTCNRCGAALTGQAPLPNYLVAESRDQDELMREPELIERALNHPHLMPLVDLFTYAPYGPPRHYTVAEARQGVALGQFTLPRPAEQVMVWAEQLSAALRYLHNEGVISPGATPENILIKDDEAVLANLQNAQPASDDPATRQQQIGDDLALLAATLYETLTGRYATALGREQPLLDARYPPVLEEAFNRALRPAPGATPIDDAEWNTLISEAAAIIAAPPASIRIRSGRLSDVGMVRALNEDSLAVVECQAVQESISAGLGLYVVADGMGGHEGGEIASAIAIATVTERMLASCILPQFSATAPEPSAEQISAWLQTAVQAANERIHSERSSRGTDMGTTITALVVAGDRAYIANVGDSRAYLLRKGAPIEQVTEDHSMVQRLISTGQITEEEAKYHPYRHVIYRSLGEKFHVEIDSFAERLRPGDCLLVCSDGLSGMVPDADLGAVLAGYSDPQEACTALITRANAAGGNDNITAVVVYVEVG